jgi:GNAT superfamily N-acetyltransferase
MKVLARPVELSDILLWRDLYRQDMNCQVVHDSLHVRKGWTQSYLLQSGGAAVGYGAIAMGGPWTGKRTLFEFYVAPPHRFLAFDLFHAMVAVSQATHIEVQTNDPLLTVMLHAFAHNVASERIVFDDQLTTGLASPGAVLRHRGDPDNDWVLEIAGECVGKGGILYHYNRPYGDIYMEVAEPWRRRGLGSYLVQELKRLCYAAGSVPCARCSTGNLASRKTLQKAGFVPCAHILTGSLPARIQGDELASAG